MVQAKSYKEKIMFSGIRRFSMAAMVALVSFVASAPAAQLQAQGSLQLESKVFDFKDMVQVDEVKKSTVQFKAILGEFKDAIKEAKTIVSKARRAYLANKVDATEAKLIEANSKARTIQFTSLEKYKEAAEQHVNAMVAAFGELERGKIALEKQVAEGLRDEAATLEAAGKVREQLAEIANNKEFYVDTNGKLDPKTKADVKRLNALYKIKFAENRGAAIFRKQAEAHRKAFVRTEARLVKRKSDLANSVEVAVVLLASIGKNADWEARSLKMRNLAKKFNDLANSMPEDVTEFFPDVGYMGLPGEAEDVSRGDVSGMDEDEEIDKILDGFKSSPKKATARREPAREKPAAAKKATQVETSVPSAIFNMNKALRSMEKGKSNAN